MSSVDDQLEAIYAELPDIDCQGRCWDSCGPIEMSKIERDRIRKAGVEIPFGSFHVHGPYKCPALTMFHQCSVYSIRPIICRIWGLSRRLPCTYGCRPERYLSEPEIYELMARIFDLSGQPQEARMARLAASPEHQAKMAEINEYLDVETALTLRRLSRRGRKP